MPSRYGAGYLGTKYVPGYSTRRHTRKARGMPDGASEQTSLVTHTFRSMRTQEYPGVPKKGSPIENGKSDCSFLYWTCAQKHTW